MRKISIFSLVITFILSIFLGISSVFAQSKYQYASGVPHQSPEVKYCNSDTESCSLRSGLDDAQKKLNGNITDKEVSDYAQDVIMYLLGFMSLIGVIYIIWA